eukprot:COSAG06_NODE_39011_length_417_cov_0.971698_1_plen_44_part_10
MVATPDALGEIRISPLEGLIEVSPVGIHRPYFWHRPWMKDDRLP